MTSEVPTHIISIFPPVVVNAKAVLIDDELADITFPSTQFTDEVNMTSRFSVLNRLNEGNNFPIIIMYSFISQLNAVSVVIPASVLRERASMGEECLQWNL